MRTAVGGIVHETNTDAVGIVDGIDDFEADLGAKIRATIGPDIPLLTTLDLHGSITGHPTGGCIGRRQRHR